MAPPCPALWVLLVAGATGSLPVRANSDGATDSPHPQVVGITTPYRQATLAAIQPGLIAAIQVEEGALVKQGEVVGVSQQNGRILSS